jgi:hypothetical protein
MHYLMKHNADMEAANRRFRRSLAFWVVITHMLGVGDRHLHNVMVRESGELFHIDFGFLLGEQTMLEARPRLAGPAAGVRLCEVMLEALGDEHRREFRRECTAIYLCLRRHAAALHACLAPCAEGPAATDRLRQFVDERCGFRDGRLLDDAEASSRLDDLLDRAEKDGEFFKHGDRWHAWAMAGGGGSKPAAREGGAAG